MTTDTTSTQFSSIADEGFPDLNVSVVGKNFNVHRWNVEAKPICPQLEEGSMNNRLRWNWVCEVVSDEGEKK